MNSARLKTATLLTTALMLAASFTLSGCGGSSAEANSPDGIDPAKVADMLHTVMEADRTTYVQKVVNRLTKEQTVELYDPDSGEKRTLIASEEWANEHGNIPLPAQLFRMGAERARDQAAGSFDYQLLSSWPINKQHAPRSDLEKEGLAFIESNEGTAPFYGTEEIAGKKYFTALYADLGVAAACVDCHNQHIDSPKTDFKLGDVMGGIVIRLPLD